MSWLLTAAAELVRPFWDRARPIAHNVSIDRVWAQKVTDDYGNDPPTPLLDDEIARTARKVIARGY